MFDGIFNTAKARKWALTKIKEGSLADTVCVKALAFNYLERYEEIYEEIIKEPFEVGMIWAGDEPDKSNYDFNNKNVCYDGKGYPERCYDYDLKAYQLRKDNLLIKGFEKDENNVDVFKLKDIELYFTDEGIVCIELDTKDYHLQSFYLKNPTLELVLLTLDNLIAEYNRKHEAVKEPDASEYNLKEELAVLLYEEATKAYKQAQKSIIRLDCSPIEKLITG